MQRYEFNDGKSSKFWQIEQVGSELHISWGKIGTSGQSQVKDFDTEAKATAAKDKLVKEKTGKGYVAAGEAPMAAGASVKLKAEPKAKAEPGEGESGGADASAKPPKAASKAKPSGKAKAAAGDDEEGDDEDEEVAQADDAPSARPASASSTRAATPSPASAASATAASTATPSPAAPIASLQAPRDDIEAWLTDRRTTPSVDERALQAWPRVLQKIAATGTGDKQGSLTVTQVQRGGQVDDDAMPLIDAWLVDSGLSHGYGFSGLGWINQGDRARAAQRAAEVEAELPQRLAQLADMRTAIWAPLAASEPDAAWPQRLGHRPGTTGADAWPTRSQGPWAKVSKHSATEAWYLLRKAQMDRFNAAKSDASLRDAIDKLADRLSNDIKPVPDEDSDQIL